MCILYKPVFNGSDSNNDFHMQYSQFSNVHDLGRGKIDMNNWALKA